MRSCQNIITDIQTLVIHLAKSFLNSAAQDYILYFNNLFINEFLAKTLEQLDIEVMKTTQIKTLRQLDIKIMRTTQVKTSELSLIIR